MSIRLTLCGSNVCLGRNLITVFFTVNTPTKIFFAGPPARRLPGRCRDACAHTSKDRSTAATVAVDKKKLLLFSCIVRAVARGRDDEGAWHACARRWPQAVSEVAKGGENFFRQSTFRGTASVEMRKLLRPAARREDRFGCTRACCDRRIDARPSRANASPRAGRRTVAPPAGVLDHAGRLHRACRHPQRKTAAFAAVFSNGAG